jgi:hypothetical protein
MDDDTPLPFDRRETLRDRQRNASLWCKRFAEVCRETAKRDDVTFRMLADDLDVSLGTVSNWLKHPETMKLPDAHRLAEILDVYAFAEPE